MPDAVQKVEELLRGGNLAGAHAHFYQLGFGARWKLVLGKVYSVMTRVAQGSGWNEGQNVGHFSTADEAWQCFTNPLACDDGYVCMNYSVSRVGQDGVLKKDSGHLKVKVGKDKRSGAPIFVAAHQLVAWLVPSGSQAGRHTYSGLVVHHSCKCPKCLNPAHLVWVTRLEHEAIHARV